MTKNNSTSLLTGIQKYGHPYIKYLILAAIFALLGSSATIIGPGQLSRITNLVAKGLVGHIDLQQVWQITILLAVLYVIGAILTYLQGFIVATVTQRFTQKLRTNIGLKINHLPLKYFDTHDEGDTLSRVTNDLDTLGQSLNQSLGTLISSSILLIGSIIMMTITNVWLSLTAIFSVLAGFILTMFLMAKSQKYFNTQQNRLADISGYLEEIYTGHEVVKAYNYLKTATEKFNKINNDLYNNVWKSQFLSGIMQPLMNFVGNFGYVAVTIVGSVLVLNNTISIGTVVAFIIYVRIFTQPLSQITQSFASLQSAQAAMKRVFSFLNADEVSDETNKIAKIEKPKGDVVFNHVSFGYNSNQTIIKDFNVHVKPGQKVAIVGPTGSGKTTLVSLLMRFYELHQGNIKIDGIDIQNMRREEVRNQFDMVLQDTWLFADTIKNNLKYNQKNVTDKQIEQATKAVGIDHFIHTLPEGYDTVLDDSVSLSAGQKQLLTIARALIRNKPMLILDEATSSVDTRTEEKIQKAMDILTANRTSFIIAHRLSTIKNADLILVVKDGQIIEQGTHDKLIEANGFYSELYNSQFEA
ncbi:ABC transporter ATP-binding protein [Pediococcus siamensis]|uniref:ABC transporter ATP-binding protein n=1 Tax=Pediococcus siamensis TaxID=381829 RepID=UPI0039A3E82C